MDLTFELPHKQLKTLGKHNDINFTLAHLVSNEEYLTYYREANKYTICDNSAFELQNPLPAPTVIKAASLLKAQEVVAPDSFGSGTGTIESTNEFIKYLEDSGNLGKFRVMGVVQGANVPDWINCLMHLRDNKHVDVIGFSYIGCKSFDSNLSNARIGAVRLATNEGIGNLKKPIHLLGMGGNPIELVTHRDVETVRSCDTSIPVVQGLACDKFCPERGMLGAKLSRPENYFDVDPDANQMDAILHNIATMKQWVSKVNA